MIIPQGGPVVQQRGGFLRCGNAARRGGFKLTLSQGQSAMISIFGALRAGGGARFHRARLMPESLGSAATEYVKVR